MTEGIVGFVIGFAVGLILMGTNMEEIWERDAVKVGHAFYTNDVNGASVWAWKTVKD